MARPEEDQGPVVAFLSDASAYGIQAGQVERISTHISHIFLVGDRAYKLKRAVTLPYLDFSTPGRRREACQRELELNRRTAPGLYLRVSAVTCDAAGRLAIDGEGSAVDWLVTMKRFDDRQLLDRLAAEGRLSHDILIALADTIWRFHQAAESVPDLAAATTMTALVDGIAESFSACSPDAFPPGVIIDLLAEIRRSLIMCSGLLEQRGWTGKVRRCHGDLHLRNICLIDGAPVLFDCIEFSDAFGTIDVLYDLAFLLMDLSHRGLNGGANLVFNRYFDRAGECEAAALLPLFLAVRAAIRAHITASAASEAARFAEARAYADLARHMLDPRPPCLIAVGGLSGTGKSTLAYGLAPTVGRPPGARVLRSDIMRKRLFGIAPEAPLPEDAYGQDTTARVYAILAAEACIMLKAGHSVIVDAVFAAPAERTQLEAAAASAGVAFTGLWLDAPASELERRIAQRRNDASDATPAVLRRQLTYDLGSLGWRRIDAAGSAADALARAQTALGAPW